MKGTKIFRFLPKLRFYLIAFAAAGTLSFCVWLGDQSFAFIPGAAYTTLLLVGYMVFINHAGAMNAALQRGGEGAKYFRSIPGAYAKFKRSVILGDVFGVVCTAVFAAISVLAGLEPHKSWYLLTAALLILIAGRVIFFAKTPQQSLLMMCGTGGLIGMCGVFLSFCEFSETRSCVLAVIVAVLAAAWIVCLIAVYRKLPLLWNRD